ncbi:glycosyltransferase family 4 protein [Herpetosiphon geysericola]|uniref:Glycosyl transferase family 1 n=1 Tax=Herpetosiphon geysericola TaxID=70996 RepID=A0A0P6YKW9_9CHLR|nr:glycosyltransferase family 4 protein [Herpetosiphon geysericola]KPL90484.1 glycosyl transferase family 1 [Herpetosiphon geysericola]
MKVLYIASGIRVPGAFGGAIHTTEVAQGLAQLGVEMHVVTRPAQGQRRKPWQLPKRQTGSITWYEADLPKPLSLLGYPAIARLVRELQPDAVMERYYNFAGAGILAAARQKIPTLLEVNALIVDPPQVRKRQLDDALSWLLPGSSGPMRRWAAWQCRHSSKIVTPLHTTVPPEIERSRIVELPWGANVQAFSSQTKPPAQPVFVFLGSFRHWHGVTDFIQAAIRLIQQGSTAKFLLIGSGPEQAEAQRLAAPYAEHFEWAGAVAHERVPGLLAQASVGVAPFNPVRHPALQAAGFFWSPLKIYEYMAAGLPVVTANIPPLDTIIRPQQEGGLFEAGNIADLARVMQAVANDPQRQQWGQNARQRVVEHYSWEQHCQALKQILQTMITQR